MSGIRIASTTSNGTASLQVVTARQARHLHWDVAETFKVSVADPESANGARIAPVPCQARRQLRDGAITVRRDTRTMEEGGGIS